MAKGNFLELIQSKKPILIDFHASWCGPCKAMAPVIEQLKNEVGDKVRVIKIDVDKNPVLAQSYEVQGVPTFMIFKEGSLKWRKAGVIPLSKLKAELQPFV